MLKSKTKIAIYSQKYSFTNVWKCYISNYIPWKRNNYCHSDLFNQLHFLWFHTILWLLLQNSGTKLPLPQRDNIHISTSKTPLLFLPWSTKPFISCLNLRFQTSIEFTFYFILWAQATPAFLLLLKHAKIVLLKGIFSYSSLYLQYCPHLPTLPLILSNPAPSH